MKYVICHSNYDVLNKNGYMLNGVGDVSVKDFLRQMSELKAEGLTNDVDFRTSGEIPLAEADAFIFVDMPNPTDGYFLSAMETGKPLFLLVWESAIINPRNTIKKYTAFIPKTVKATKNISVSAVKNVQYFLKNSVQTLKKLSKNIDRRTAKSIRSLTKRRQRR